MKRPQALLVLAAMLACAACAQGSGPSGGPEVADQGAADAGTAAPSRVPGAVDPQAPDASMGPPGPSVCGNGLVEAGEDCDAGPANSDDPASASACTTACKARALCPGGAGSAGAFIAASTGHCFVGWNTPANWDTALANCKSLGGSLAVVHDAVQERAVEAMPLTAYYWLGLRRDGAAGTGSGFLWSDGRGLDFESWAQGEPGTDAPPQCAALLVAPGLSHGWYAFSCSSRESYICEHAPGPIR